MSQYPTHTRHATATGTPPPDEWVAVWPDADSAPQTRYWDAGGEHWAGGHGYENRGYFAQWAPLPADLSAPEPLAQPLAADHQALAAAARYLTTYRRAASDQAWRTYRALATPATVLALLAALDKAESRVRELQAELAEQEAEKLELVQEQQGGPTKAFRAEVGGPSLVLGPPVAPANQIAPTYRAYEQAASASGSTRITEKAWKKLTPAQREEMMPSSWRQAQAAQPQEGGQNG